MCPSRAWMPLQARFTPHPLIGMSANIDVRLTASRRVSNSAP
jgi:hypothetical protein